MSEVKRYGPTCDCVSEMAWGDYVLASYYEALQAERDQLKARVAELEARMKEQAEAKPVITILPADPYDERSGTWFSNWDMRELRKLPVGTKLYAHPPARQVPELRRLVASIQAAVNATIVPVTMTKAKAEYYKAGIRHIIAKVNKALLAAASQAEPDTGWIECRKQMPPSGQTVLAFYLNTYGMERRIRAQHVDAWTIQADDLSDPDTECVEYSEQEDAYYLLAGWYECIDNWDDYSRITVNEGTVTHWMPLPAAPTLAVEQAGGES